MMLLEYILKLTMLKKLDIIEFSEKHVYDPLQPSCQSEAAQILLLKELDQAACHSTGDVHVVQLFIFVLHLH